MRRIRTENLNSRRRGRCHAASKHTNKLGKALARMLTSLILLPAAAHAQNYSIDWFTVAGGGMRSSSGNYTLHGTVGQPAVGSMAANKYAVVGGFWSFSSPVPPADPFAGIDLTDPVQAQADPDGDGLSNLMEYGLGTDPRAFNGTQGVMAFSVSTNAAAQYLSLSFRRRKNTGSITLQYVPEVSGDRQTWSSTAVAQVQVVPLDDQFDWVTVQDTVPATESAPRFMRLRIVENQSGL